MAPMLKAPLTGSSWKGVPKTLVPLGTTVPGTMGPRSLVHSLKRRPSRPQPMVSRKTNRAVSNWYGHLSMAVVVVVVVLVGGGVVVLVMAVSLGCGVKENLQRDRSQLHSCECNWQYL